MFSWPIIHTYSKVVTKVICMTVSISAINSWEENKYILFFDLDETLFDHNDREHKWFHELESYINNLKEYYKLNYGIITGCNLAETQRKLESLEIRQLPDFVAVGFGTDIYHHCVNNNFLQDKHWNDLHLKTFNKAVVNEIVRILDQRGIHLVREKRSDNPLKESYYYTQAAQETTLSERIDLRLINLLAYKYNVKVIISRCNHNIRDPENAYDIDFIPITSGKEKVAQYLIKKFKIHKKNTFAFGDSENDLALLKSCTHGYAVDNATKNLKHYVKNVCPYDHAHGILAILQDYFEREEII